MAMVELNRERGGILVNPEHVVSVTRDHYDRMLLVKTVLGEVHEVFPNYGETIWEAQRRVGSLLAGGSE